MQKRCQYYVTLFGWAAYMYQALNKRTCKKSQVVASDLRWVAIGNRKFSHKYAQVAKIPISRHSRA